ncbi:hypothetical protein C8R47DRAFT_558291 [Mycena vitilis]|nr:hypothetical protein C8R47DRAFT_558291 [Mycena vitilis]
MIQTPPSYPPNRPVPARRASTWEARRARQGRDANSALQTSFLRTNEHDTHSPPLIRPLGSHARRLRPPPPRPEVCTPCVHRTPGLVLSVPRRLRIRLGRGQSEASPIASPSSCAFFAPSSYTPVPSPRLPFLGRRASAPRHPVKTIMYICRPLVRTARHRRAPTAIFLLPLTAPSHSTASTLVISSSWAFPGACAARRA